MEGKFQTSFIPKKPITATASTQVRSSSGVNIVTLVSVVIFIISLALAGAVFLYETYLEHSIAQMKSEFTENENAFDPNSINIYTKLNDRINVANTLLNQHISASNLFDVLEQSTLQTVRFSDFNYTYVNPTEISLSMKGQAKSYNAIAKQSDVFSQDPTSKYIHNPVFANLDLDQSGNVIFTFTADIDPSQLLYKNNLPQVAPADQTDQSTSTDQTDQTDQTQTTP